MGDFNDNEKNDSMPESTNINDNKEQQDQSQQYQYQQPSQPMYQQPVNPQYMYQQDPQEPEEKKGLAIASMVIGIVSLVFSCCIWYLALPASITGLVLGIISLRKHAGGKGMAITGVILNSLTLVVCILAIIGTIALSNYSNSYFNNIFEGIEGMEDFQYYYQ